MAKLLLWIAWLTLLFLLCVVLSPRKLLTPQFVFIGCFIPQALFAILFVDKWDLDFCTETIAALFGGTALFFAASVLFERFFSLASRTYPVAGGSIRQESPVEIRVEKWKLVLFLVLQAGILLLVIKYFSDNIPGSTMLARVANYNHMSKYGSEMERKIVRLPDWIDWPRIFSGASCYLTGYLLVHSIVYKYRQYRLLLALNILVSILNIGVLGGRINIMAFIVATVAEAYILWGKKNNWKKRLRAKTVLKVIALGVVILCGLQWSLVLFGRESDSTFLDYLGVYLAAPLKNLDIFASKGEFGTDALHWTTIGGITNFLGKRLNIPELLQSHYMAFNRVNGYGIGNAYTTFYYFLYDGGYLALVVYVLLMVFISQFAYRKAMRKSSRHSIQISVIAYSYIVFGLLLSFFDDRFYISVININFVEILVICWVLRPFFTTMRFRIGKSKPVLYSAAKNIKSGQKI